MVAAVEKVAKARGVTMAQVALAWLLAQAGITAPIVGVTKMAQLDDALAALDLELSEEEIAEARSALCAASGDGHLGCKLATSAPAV